MKRYLISLMIGCTLVLTACLSPPEKDHDSYFYSIPVGSKLSLNKTITIPAYLARRYFQGGRPINKKDINIYYPHCSLLMNTLADYERTIKPATFEIYKVMDDEVFAQGHIYVVANILTGNDGPTIVGYVSYYYLRSTENAEVRSLECEQWDDPHNVQYLSINQVKQSLGDYFTLQITD